MMDNVGGKYGDITNQTPLKTYKFYVDFKGFLMNLMDICKDNPVLKDNAEKREETDEETHGTNEDGEQYNDGARLTNNNSLLKNIDFYNLGRDNGELTGLDFGFYVENVNIPKFTMKTAKINYLDNVEYKPIKTSYGGELNLTIKSTFHNITKLSLLLGIFEYYDTLDLWDKVYTFNGKTTHDRGNGRGMDAVSNKTEVGSPNIDIVLVDDKIEDSVVYRIVNPIITSVDFGSFSYGTNAINEIRMTINYNSWYVIDGNTRPRDNNIAESTWDMKASKFLQNLLDGIFEDLGEYIDDFKKDYIED